MVGLVGKGVQKISAESIVPSHGLSLVKFFVGGYRYPTLVSVRAYVEN